ncbi:MAG: ABC transporter permease [Deltaproteobacteria bacterium]|nr:ABC transporter permease [Deltaproteobacteria bacterium]
MISLTLARRFLRPQQKDSFFSSLGFITMLGVLMGVTTLIVVYSVFLGFEKKLKSIIMDSYPHVLLEKRFEGSDKPLLDFLKKDDKVQGVSPLLSYQGLLSHKGQVKGVGLYGIELNSFKKVVSINKFLIQNNSVIPAKSPGHKRESRKRSHLIDLKNNEIILGDKLAHFLNVSENEKVKFVYVDDEGGTHIEELKVKAVFHIGRFEQDFKTAYVSFNWLKEKLNEKSLVSFGISLKNPYKVEEFIHNLESRFLFSYNIQTWKNVDRLFLRSIVVERRMMIVILAIIILVASFNIMSLLLIIAKKRMKEVGILLAMGAQPKLLRRVFLWMGILVCSGGIIGGVLGAFGVAFILKNYPLLELPSDVYQLSYLPIYIDPIFVIFVISLSIIICLLSVLVPSITVSKVNPIQGIQYE